MGEIIFEKLKQCPICFEKKKKEFSVLDKKILLKYSLCIKCGLIYMNPRPAQITYNNLYKKSFWEVKKKEKSNSLKTRFYRETTRALKIKDYLLKSNIRFNNNPRILEVGCAYGLLVKNIATFFNGEAWGIEPSETSSSIAKNFMGVRIYAKYIEDLFNKKGLIKFDLIIFSHSLENIINLNKTMDCLNHLLKPNGILYIDTPNNYHKLSCHLYHPYCFIEDSILNLLLKNNFKIHKIIRSGRPDIFIGKRNLSIIAKREKSTKSYSVSRYILLRIKLGNLINKILSYKYIKYINKNIALKIWDPNEKLKLEIKKFLDEIEMNSKNY